jgi:hypothetical protein
MQPAPAVPILPKGLECPGLESSRMRLYRTWLAPDFPEPSPAHEPPPAPDLALLNAQRLREDARVLILLGGTSLLGTALGTLGALAPSRARTRAFFQAATGVHLFVLGTALAGLRAVKAQRLPELGLRTTLRRSGVLQRLLGVGLGLDVASATIGTVLLRRRQQGRTAWREGAGASFLLHGLALLVFDAGVFRRNAHYHREVARMGRTSTGKQLVVRGASPQETHPATDSGLGATRLGPEQLAHAGRDRRQHLTDPRPDA